jgi:hypothetical protein
MLNDWLLPKQRRWRHFYRSCAFTFVFTDTNVYPGNFQISQTSLISTTPTSNLIKITSLSSLSSVQLSTYTTTTMDSLKDSTRIRPGEPEICYKFALDRCKFGEECWRVQQKPRPVAPVYGEESWLPCTQRSGGSMRKMYAENVPGKSTTSQCSSHVNCA